MVPSRIEATPPEVSLLGAFCSAFSSARAFLRGGGLLRGFHSLRSAYPISEPTNLANQTGITDLKQVRREQVKNIGNQSDWITIDLEQSRKSGQVEKSCKVLFALRRPVSSRLVDFVGTLVGSKAQIDAIFEGLSSS